MSKYSVDFYTRFEGHVWEYQNLVQAYKPKPENYQLFRTVSPAWDNTARRGGSANIFHNSTPEKYAEWLQDAISSTMKEYSSEHWFVFINAWNEWAEAAYLEPDRKYGYAYLNATARALSKLRENG